MTFSSQGKTVIIRVPPAHLVQKARLDEEARLVGKDHPASKEQRVILEFQHQQRQVGLQCVLQHLLQPSTLYKL